MYRGWNTNICEYRVMDHASRIMGLQWQVRRYSSKEGINVAEMWQECVHEKQYYRCRRGVAEGSHRCRRCRKKDLH